VEVRARSQLAPVLQLCLVPFCPAAPGDCSKKLATRTARPTKLSLSAVRRLRRQYEAGRLGATDDSRHSSLGRASAPPHLEELSRAYGAGGDLVRAPHSLSARCLGSATDDAPATAATRGPLFEALRRPRTLFGGRARLRRVSIAVYRKDELHRSLGHACGGGGVTLF